MSARTWLDSLWISLSDRLCAFKGCHPAGVNVRAALAAGKARRLCAAPRVMIVSDFLSSEECDHIVSSARPLLKRSSTVNVSSGKLSEDPSRTSSSACFRPAHDQLFARVEKRSADFVGVPVERSEGIQVVHYDPGQEYKVHMDTFHPLKREQGAPVAPEAQRVATIILYLSDVEAGGETWFPRLHLTIPPRKGQALVFYSLDPAGRPDTNTLHAGLPVVRGQKWIGNVWFRDRTVRSTEVYPP